MDDLALKTYPEDIIVNIDGMTVPVNSPPTLKKPTYQLLYAANASGEFLEIVGGSYVWATVADDFNNASVILQARGPNNVILDVAIATSNVAYAIFVGEGTPLRAFIDTTEGSPVNVYSDLRAYLT